MRWRYIVNVVGILTLFLGLTMVFPLMAALYYRDASVSSILISIGITIFREFYFTLSLKVKRWKISQNAKAWPL
jgi:hypothetical protein